LLIRASLDREPDRPDRTTIATVPHGAGFTPGLAESLAPE
jgi:hypothetical protein